MKTLALPPLIALAAMPLGLALQTAPSGSYSIAFTGASPLEQTSRIVAGEFNSDAVLDFAMLQGQKVSIAFDPGLIEASALLPGLYRDIASHSRTGNPGSADLLTVGTTGLKRISWNSSSDEFDIEDAIDAAAYPGLHSAWMGATKIRTGDINGDGAPDVVGIGSDLRTLLLAMSAQNGFTPSAGGSSIVQAAGDILDLTVLDHDGDGLGEVMVLSEWGVETFDSDLTLLHAYRAAATNGLLETIKGSTTGSERAAWLRPMPGGGRQLWILNGQPFGVDQILNVTALSASNITSGRFDDNASSDIAITDSTGAAIRILKQRSNGTFSSSGNDVRTIVIDNLPATDLTTPTAFGDIDADGDLDVLAARSRVSAIIIGRNDTIDHVDFAPRILEMTAQEGPQIWTTSNSVRTELHVRFEAPHSPDDPNPSSAYTHAHPAGATHLDIMVWESPQQPDGSFLTDATPIERNIIPLVESSTTLHDGIRFMQADVGYFNGWNSLTGVQYVTCRYVELDTNNDLLHAFAHNSLYFAKTDDAVILTELADLPFTFGNYDVFETDPWYLESVPAGGDGGTQNVTHSGNGSTNCVPDVVPEGVPITVPPQEEAEQPGTPAT